MTFIINLQLPSQSLLWRAILQHILLSQQPGLRFEDQQVGRTAAKSANFVDYVEKCFTKLNIELKLTKIELESIYQEFSGLYRHKLNAFYQIRSLFAPLIEGLILLDRLVFLLEQVLKFVLYFSVLKILLYLYEYMLCRIKSTMLIWFAFLIQSSVPDLMH